MKYIKDIQSKDFAKALSLTNDQVIRIKNAIAKAYNQEWDHEGPNIDQINAIVAPYIKTQEEAFYAATVIFSDVFGALMLQKAGKETE